jgi:acetyl esterase
VALDPQCKAFLDQLATAGGRPLHDLSPAAARELVLPPDLGGPEQPVGRVENRTVPGPSGPVPVRVYVPQPAGARPALVYFHGGGFVLGSLDMCDRQCRQIAHLADCVVVSVDYRLAPEHPFPAAADDAYAATRYVAEHPEEFSAVPGALAVGGESAGGNLAAVTALKARDEGRPRLAFQLLVYPQVDMDDDRPSLREFGDGHFLTRASIDWFIGHYLPDPVTRRYAYASPIRAASLAALPPAFIVVAECDPLRDQNEAYAARLEQAGVAVTVRRYRGMIHPFFSLGGIVEGGRLAMDDAVAALRAALGAVGA